MDFTMRQTFYTFVSARRKHPEKPKRTNQYSKKNEQDPEKPKPNPNP